jgi:hypothetical protein
MFVYLHRQGTHPSMPASKAGTRLRRVAAALAAVTAGLLAWAAAIPAAFAREVSVPSPGSGYEIARFGLVPATTSHPAATGMPGWQITVIALGAALFAATAAVLLYRALTARRSVAVTA